MADKPSEERVGSHKVAAGAGERFVYVMPEQLVRDSANYEIDLRKLWGIIWSRKWRIVAGTVLFAAASIAYALLATEWYRAETLLAPAEEKNAPALGGQLGGLAALAGVSIGGGDLVEAVATLRSRDFAREFIEERELLPVLLADDWDGDSQRWHEDDPLKQPDIRDAVRYFHENVLKVSEDRQTSLVTVAIEWTDPHLAAAWAADVVEKLNERLRERALREAEANVGYLREEMTKTNVVAMQDALGSLLESEMQKLMIARGQNDFAFRIIDEATPPKYSIRPNKLLVASFGVVTGAVISIVVLLLIYLIRKD